MGSLLGPTLPNAFLVYFKNWLQNQLSIGMLMASFCLSHQNIQKPSEIF